MLNRFRTQLRHNLVAYLALFFALGGTAIAAKPLVSGADVKDGSLTGADVSDDSTLKGVDIDESDLRKVPSAQNADNAANADTLDGKDSTDFTNTTGGFTGDTVFFVNNCERKLVLERDVTVAHPSRVFAAATVEFGRTTENAGQMQVEVILEGGGLPSNALTGSFVTGAGPPHQVEAQGVISSDAGAVTNQAVTLLAGNTYTIKAFAHPAHSQSGTACAATTGLRTTLTYLLIGDTD